MDAEEEEEEETGNLKLFWKILRLTYLVLYSALAMLSTVGIWILTIWIPETFEYWTFWIIDFVWIQMVEIRLIIDWHPKTGLVFTVYIYQL